MKPIALLPYTVGLLLLAITLFIIAYAIHYLIGNNIKSALIDILLLLELIFIGWYHYMCSEKAKCSSFVNLLIRSFYVVFFALTVFSANIFALNGKATTNVYFDEMVAAFWILFAVLLLIGAGLSLSFLLGMGNGKRQKTPYPNNSIQSPHVYGQAGYHNGIIK